MIRGYSKGIEGMRPAIYFGVALVVLLGLYLKVLPDNMMTGLVVTMTLGGSLAWIGDRVPGFRTFGGAPILCILFPSLLVYWNLFPESGVKIVETFFAYFLDLFIASVLVGSILSINREILIKAGIRMLVPICGAIVTAFVVGGVVGHLTGFGFAKAILYVVAPMMGGGIGAGAIPMSEMYAARAGGNPALYVSALVPVIMLGNIFCILGAALLNGLGKQNKGRFGGFSGEGQMLRSAKMLVDSRDEMKTPSSGAFSSMAVGIVAAGALYVLGNLIASVVPALHAYAWMIIATGIVKTFDWAPASVQRAAGEWYGFVSKTWIPAILVAVSISLIHMQRVIEVLTDPAYLGLILLTVLAASIGAGCAGWLVSMYYVESSITAGLCIADAGGSGDVAVLSASDRLHLMPFAAMSTRLGGALILVIMSILIPLLI